MRQTKETSDGLMDFETLKQIYRISVESFLESAFDKCADNAVTLVGRYIALRGGHRWRALVAAAAGQIFDSNSSEIVLPGAAGVELSHAASLVLDDLPSMDDATTRRGRPCAHRVFPKWAVDMAPVFLVTLAYKLALANPLASHERRVRSALVVSHAGIEMIAGQSSDVLSTVAENDEEKMMTRYRQKSGALYSASAEAGAILCGALPSCAERLGFAGMHLGLAYQFLDDVADATADVKDVGKDTHIDTGKLTAVNLYGVEGTTKRSFEYQQQAIEALQGYGKEADCLRQIISHASWAPS